VKNAFFNVFLFLGSTFFTSMFLHPSSSLAFFFKQISAEGYYSYYYLIGSHVRSEQVVGIYSKERALKFNHS